MNRTAGWLVAYVLLSGVLMLALDWMPEWVFWLNWIVSGAAFVLALRTVMRRSHAGEKAITSGAAFSLLGSGCLVALFAASCFGGWLLTFK